MVSTIALNGARTVFCADVNFDAAQKTCDVVHERASVAKRDVKLEAVHVDVTKEESVQDMMNRVEHRATRLDYFVNSSGVSPGFRKHEKGLNVEDTLTTSVVRESRPDLAPRNVTGDRSILGRSTQYWYVFVPASSDKVNAQARAHGHAGGGPWHALKPSSHEPW